MPSCVRRAAVAFPLWYQPTKKDGKGKRQKIYVECPILYMYRYCVCAETKACVCIEWKQDSSFDGTSMAKWEKAKMLFSFGLKNFPHKLLVDASLFSLSQFPPLFEEY